MENKSAKVIDGWLVCSCGRKLAEVDGKTVKVVCRGTRFTGKHFAVIVPKGAFVNGCSCDNTCDSASLN